MLVCNLPQLLCLVGSPQSRCEMLRCIFTSNPSFQLLIGSQAAVCG